MVEKLYTPEEAAEVIKLKPATVRKMLRAGILQGIKTNPAGSGKWRTTEAYLQGYIDSRKPEAQKR